MKKFIKWSLIIGFVSCLLGVGMMSAGAMMGGGEGLVSYLRNGRFSLLGRYSEAPYSGEWRESLTGSGQLHNENQGEGEVFTGIAELEIEAGPGLVELVEEHREDSQDTSLRIIYEDGSQLKYQIYQERDTLKIQLPERSRRGLDGWRMETLLIYVPEGYRFREVNVEAMAGEVRADILYADKLELESKAGTITIGGGQAGRLEADCMSGVIECMAKVEYSADADCKAGSLSFSMAEGKDQYDYELECKTGQIILAGEETEEYNSLWQKKYIDHRAGKQVELDCAAGKITVYFPESL